MYLHLNLLYIIRFRRTEVDRCMPFVPYSYWCYYCKHFIYNFIEASKHVLEAILQNLVSNYLLFGFASQSLINAIFIFFLFVSFLCHIFCFFHFLCLITYILTSFQTRIGYLNW